ncbi:MAG: glycosyltransferase [Bdellovibrionales bacterium CG12_big_fil_rev_8_21_14_0_65_38_15]|nr:MAG: glycosyltransferase [Bdellovibrionales bacterium CG12_big_fil_rev_8_21_14_0_65_38_15]
MSSPKVSVILPVYNGEEYLDQAIKSVLFQSYKNLELIIVDDCSTDRSLEIAKTWVKDDRVKIISNISNQKLPKSLNIGSIAASGEYHTWISHDNYFAEKFIETYVNLISTEKVDIVYGNYFIVNSRGDVEGDGVVGSEDELPFSNMIGASFLYKKDVFHSLNGYSENLFLLEDYDFWLRSYNLGFKFLISKDKNYYYRVHVQSLSSRETKILNMLAQYQFRMRKTNRYVDDDFHFKFYSRLIYKLFKTRQYRLLLLITVESFFKFPKKFFGEVFHRVTGLTLGK